VLRSVRATGETRISVLGQNDRVLEYSPGVVPKTTWTQQPDGLHIRAMRAQRIYNDRKWPNPVVLKITHAQAALTPPRVATGRWRMDAGMAVLEGELLDMGKAAALEVGFEYRSIKGQDVNERTEPWKSTTLTRQQAPGRFSARVSG
jgi:alpha-L-fucosidase